MDNYKVNFKVNKYYITLFFKNLQGTGHLTMFPYKNLVALGGYEYPEFKMRLISRSSTSPKIFNTITGLKGNKKILYLKLKGNVYCFE